MTINFFSPRLFVRGGWIEFVEQELFNNSNQQDYP